MNIVFWGKYTDMSLYLFKSGAAMGCFALAYLLTNYLVSINRTKVAYLLAGNMLLQAVFFIIWHASIAQIVNVMLLTGIICLISASGFLFIARKGSG